VNGALTRHQAPATKGDNAAAMGTARFSRRMLRRFNWFAIKAISYLHLMRSHRRRGFLQPRLFTAAAFYSINATLNN
jgi:hypothetical protein